MPFCLLERSRHMAQQFLYTVVVSVAMLVGLPAAARPDRNADVPNSGDQAARPGGSHPLAEQGGIWPHTRLGDAYDEGDAVPPADTAAVTWYRRMALQGNSGAQFGLAIMYANGWWGMPQDHAEAAKWYRRAADQGVAAAQFDLSVMYANGRGVPRNYVAAYMWCSLAAAQGHAMAAANRDAMAMQLTPAEITKAGRMVREWLEAHWH